MRKAASLMLLQEVMLLLLLIVALLVLGPKSCEFARTIFTQKVETGTMHSVRVLAEKINGYDPDFDQEIQVVAIEVEEGEKITGCVGTSSSSQLTYICTLPSLSDCEKAYEAGLCRKVKYPLTESFYVLPTEGLKNFHLIYEGGSFIIEGLLA